jgi:hypothetical protein
VLDVPEVELDALGPGQLRAPVDLGPAGDARLHGQAPALALGVAVDLDRHRRPRAHDRHVAAQDVDEVGHLVERRAPQQAPDAGDPRVSLAHRQAGAHVLGACDHRAQLEHVEGAAVLAHAPLAVDRAAARLQADGDDRDEQEGRRDEQRRSGNDHVEYAARHQRVPSGGLQPAGVPWRR